MAALDHDAELIEETLCRCAQRYAAPDRFRTLMAFDRERGQFLLMDEGWEGYRRIHRVWLHIELREAKFWIHEDGTEEGRSDDADGSRNSAGTHRTCVSRARPAPYATEFATA